MSEREYERLRRLRPELFRNDDGPGAIEITAPAAAGSGTPGAAPPPVGPVGVVYADPYIRVLRDPVRFPDGRNGTYIRILPTAESPGCAVLPLLDGRIVLLENFRHATRSWELEIPRGFGTDGLSGQENALKELREELSARTAEISPLGAVHPDTGLYAQRVELFLARLESIGEPERAVGIRGVRLVSEAELEGLVREGEVTDGFTLSALAQARVRGLL
ncbi:NUDIX hydrolase [Streptomyces aidingensis]|uniref:NUDIX hydrolase n=1 Tax=Streptomyces aidingensis TaxID=910347 RepID=UPI000B823BD6|nr:NUDIX hydrolase [Streptomyces aidingensis]